MGEIATESSIFVKVG